MQVRKIFNRLLGQPGSQLENMKHEREQEHGTRANEHGVAGSLTRQKRDQEVDKKTGLQ